MSIPLLVIVTGPPCSGKTTLGSRLAADLGLPFVNKDGIKELLFDRLGWGDRPWSNLLSLASYDLLFHFVEAQLRSGKSLVVESNFKPEYHDAVFRDFRRRVAFDVFQILCRTDGKVLVERFRQRAESDQRHPGHVDHLTLAELREALLTGVYAPLTIDGPIHEMDTTDFTRADYPVLLAAVKHHLPFTPKIPEEPTPVEE